MLKKRSPGLEKTFGLKLAIWYQYENSDNDNTTYIDTLNWLAGFWRTGFHRNPNRTAPSAARCSGRSAQPGTGVHLGRRLLVPRRKSLEVARRVLHTLTLWRGSLGSSAI